ncbi:BrnT family toxin [Candidatus Poribacteria bacterium]|nr:BrnT family toxin [Candidatus Poribacteria bacterium]MYI93474.1 BrnT family toxin [Candidatus Poribacteria bacterium]
MFTIISIDPNKSLTVKDVGLEFQWDSQKAKENLRKHSISFEEAKTVFSDFFSLTIPDPIHSKVEERLVTIGYSEKQRLLVVVHTERDDEIRIISSRKATSYERKTYEARYIKST